MRSIEFLREEGAGNDQPMSDAAYAAQRAQGEKSLNAVKGFFGSKPAAATPAAAAPAAKPAPPGTSIDPIVRQRLGYGPATQKEIADYQAANPNYGNLVSSDGRPVQSGTPGVTVAAGGEQAVTKAAQTAAPFSRGDAHAGQGGTNYQEPAAPPVPAATPVPAVAPISRGDAHAGQGGTNYQEPAVPTPVAPPATLTPSPVAPVATNSAAADAAERAGFSDELNLIKNNAGLVAAPDAAAPEAQQQIQAPGEQGRGAAAPTAAPTAPATAQEIANLNGIANINKIRAGQILKMPNGSTYTVKPGDTLGKIAAMPAQGATPVPKTAPRVSPNPVPAPKPAPGATPAPVDPTKLSVAQRMATQPSPVDQFRAKVGIPAGGTSPAARPVRESKFDESVNLMRRLSTMLKG